MTTGVRCPFIVLELWPDCFCVCIICGHLRDNPKNLTGQQRQSPLNDKIFFSFNPSHIRNGSYVSVMYYSEKVPGNLVTFQMNL